IALICELRLFFFHRAVDCNQLLRSHGAFKSTTNKADCCQFFLAQTTHCNTQVLYICSQKGDCHVDTGHTLLPLTHPVSALLQDPPGAVGSFSAPGDQLNRPSRSGMDRSVLFFFCMFFCWVSYWRKPLVNTGRTCKLHTERPGR